jgi:hypothetical protein
MFKLAVSCVVVVVAAVGGSATTPAKTTRVSRANLSVITVSACQLEVNQLKADLAKAQADLPACSAKCKALSGAPRAACEVNCNQPIVIFQLSLHEQELKCQELAVVDAQAAASTFVTKHKDCRQGAADTAEIQCKAGPDSTACMTAYPYSPSCTKLVSPLSPNNNKYSQPCCKPW